MVFEIKEISVLYVGISKKAFDLSIYLEFPKVKDLRIPAVCV